MSQFCSACGREKPYGSSVALCPLHITPLAPYLPPPPESAAAEDGTPDAPSSAGAAVSDRPWTTLVCWNCDTPSANSANSECLRCGKRLVPPRLVLKFEFGGAVELNRGESAELGREGPHARLFRDSFPNVSRRHARVGVEPDGRAWIEPRPTPNGTFHGADGKELDSEVRYPLRSDDQLRFALHAKASVILYALPDS